MEILMLLTSQWVTIENPLSTVRNKKIAIELVMGEEKEEAMEISVILTSYLLTIENPLSTMRNV